MPEELFSSAKTTDRYPKEMYYRLLSAFVLPDDVEKILYLDPDILVINPIDELWNLEMDNFMFAAASHTRLTDTVNEMNKMRLGTDNDYYNSGVMLMNVARCRENVKPEEIFHYLDEHGPELVLPDQDVLNALYGSEIIPLDDARWNLDVRYCANYLIRSGGNHTPGWIIENTSILHFCGREKPWKKGYRRRFGTLYRHYMNLMHIYLD